MTLWFRLTKFTSCSINNKLEIGKNWNIPAENHEDVVSHCMTERFGIVVNLHWQWRWVFHHLGETHTHNGDPAWSCCCGTSICSCLSGFLLETLPLCGAPPPRAPSSLHSPCTESGKFTHTQTDNLALSGTHVSIHSIGSWHVHSLKKERNRKVKQTETFIFIMKVTILLVQTSQTHFLSYCSVWSHHKRMFRLLGTIWTSAFPDTNLTDTHNKTQFHIYMHIKTDILQNPCHLIDCRWLSWKRNHTALKSIERETERKRGSSSEMDWAWVTSYCSAILTTWQNAHTSADFFFYHLTIKPQKEN